MAQYQWKDHYYQKAKKENYLARSVFKLEEIQKRYRLLQSGQQLLDLGAAPGSWCQYASAQIGNRGKLFAIDLQPLAVSLPQVTFIQGDLKTLEWSVLGVSPASFHGVLSDMAPRTSGVPFADQSQSFELCQLALQWAVQALRPGGFFICKFFQGPDFEAFRKQLRDVFERVQLLKPQSTRPGSKEIFFIAQGFQGGGG